MLIAGVVKGHRRGPGALAVGLAVDRGAAEAADRAEELADVGLGDLEGEVGDAELGALEASLRLLLLVAVVVARGLVLPKMFF